MDDEQDNNYTNEMTSNPILDRARPSIKDMKGYSSARSKYKNQSGMIFLDANECPYDPYIGAHSFSRYPNQQPAPIRENLCRLYDVSSRHLAATRGADEAIDLLVRAFCEPSRDNIITCPPTFSMYAHAAKLQGAEVKEVPLREDFQPDQDRIVKNSDYATKLVFLCSPNNPTGNLVPIDIIQTLCKEFSGRALIIVDETYIEFAQPAASALPLLEAFPNLVILRTLSKSYAAAGVRCGAMIAHSEIVNLILKIMPPYPFPQPVVQAVTHILTQENLARLDHKRTELLDRKENFIKALETIRKQNGCVQEIYPSAANFLLIRFKNAEEIMNKALSYDIIIRDQSLQMGLDNCVRISIGREDEMALLLEIIRNGGPATLPGHKTERTASVSRTTNETAISVKINLDRNMPVSVKTGIGFYDHMIEQIARHGGFSLELECAGDLHIDAHHSVEDCAIAMGEALRQALGDKRGISRYGFTLPMDEALASVALDLSGRSFLKFQANFPDKSVGELPVDMIEHIFRSLAESMKATLHIHVSGDNSHHMAEACFKAFGRALRQAAAHNLSDDENLPSSKGLL